VSACVLGVHTCTGPARVAARGRPAAERQLPAPLAPSITSHLPVSHGRTHPIASAQPEAYRPDQCRHPASRGAATLFLRQLAAGSISFTCTRRRRTSLVLPGSARQYTIRAVVRWAGGSSTEPRVLSSQRLAACPKHCAWSPGSSRPGRSRSHTSRFCYQRNDDPPPECRQARRRVRNHLNPVALRCLSSACVIWSAMLGWRARSAAGPRLAPTRRPPRRRSGQRPGWRSSRGKARSTSCPTYARCPNTCAARPLSQRVSDPLVPADFIGVKKSCASRMLSGAVPDPGLGGHSAEHHAGPHSLRMTLTGPVLETPRPAALQHRRALRFSGVPRPGIANVARVDAAGPRHPLPNAGHDAMIVSLTCLARAAAPLGPLPGPGRPGAVRPLRRDDDCSTRPETTDGGRSGASSCVAATSRWELCRASGRCGAGALRVTSDGMGGTCGSVGTGGAAGQSRYGTGPAGRWLARIRIRPRLVRA